MIRALFVTSIVFMLAFCGGSPAFAQGAAPRVPGRCAVECREDGKCAYDQNEEECVAIDDAACRRSELCRDRGRCVASDNSCIAVAESDCRASTECGEDHKCHLEGRGCASRRREPAMFVTGLALLGTGGVNAIVGGLYHGVISLGEAFFPGDGKRDERRDFANTMLVIGGALGLLGTTLTIYGNEKQHRDEAPQVTLGLGTGSLLWRF